MRVIICFLWIYILRSTQFGCINCRFVFFVLGSVVIISHIKGDVNLSMTQFLNCSRECFPKQAELRQVLKSNNVKWAKHQMDGYWHISTDTGIVETVRVHGKGSTWNVVIVWITHAPLPLCCNKNLAHKMHRSIVSMILGNTKTMSTYLGGSAPTPIHAYMQLQYVNSLLTFFTSSHRDNSWMEDNWCCRQTQWNSTFKCNILLAHLMQLIYLYL